MEYLEQLVREWYEYQGYFVRQDLWVGLEADGSYECDLSIVAFHPTRRHLSHIEPSFDLLSWEEREQHFLIKFEAGRKYLHRIFGGDAHLHIDHTALIVSSERPRAHTIAGGRVVLVVDFLAEILASLCRLDMTTEVVPEQWALIRTLQFVAANRERLVPVLGASLAKETAAAAAAAPRGTQLTNELPARRPI